MAHPLLVRAAKCIEQARALNDEFPDKTQMPAQVARSVDKLLAEAVKFRNQARRDTQFQELDEYLREPDFKHDMGGGEGTGSMSAAGIDGDQYDNPRNSGTKSFFDFVRKGYAGMRQEHKAALVQDTEGQVLVPTDFAGTILRELPRQTTIRPLATVRPTSSNKVDVGVVNISAAGWGKLETGTVAADGLAADPADKDTITVFDLNALVKIGIDELDDADANLATVISDALMLKVAEQEDDAFANGNGTSQPGGIAQATTIVQGVTAAAGETATVDELKRTIFAVPAQFRRKANAVWLGHSSAEEKIALLKDADGRYMLQPNVAAGEPDTLMGYRWYTVDGLPAITTTVGASDKSVIFGDVKQGYMIAHRQQLTVKRLEERYADEGKVGLLFRHRVGGAVIRPKAFAWYKL